MEKNSINLEKLNNLKSQAMVLKFKINEALGQNNLTADELKKYKKDVERYNEILEEIKKIEAKQKSMYATLTRDSGRSK